ncbi:MAG: DUF2469 domain-containing protein [Actinomycetota bacterium]
MSMDDLEKYEADLELSLYREYRDVVSMFNYVVETERRFYLANHVDVKPMMQGSDSYLEITLTDAWVWDIYRPARFVASVRVITYEDVNIEELKRDTVPDSPESLS